MMSYNTMYFNICMPCDDGLRLIYLLRFNQINKGNYIIEFSKNEFMKTFDVVMFF